MTTAMSGRKELKAGFEAALVKVPLSDVQREVVANRYIPLVQHLRKRTTRISCMFHSSRIIVTVGSVLVPALLSIQYSQGMDHSLQIYWTAWSVSLLVTICNGLLTLFKLDKRYFFLHTVLEQMISVGWQYIELSGRFSGFYTPGQTANHANQFIYFCHAVEKLRMRQVQEEYYNLNEASTPASTAAQVAPAPTNSIVDTLIPPTPLKAELKGLPKELISLLYPTGIPKQVTGDGSRPSANTETPEEKSPEHGESQSVPMP